jgi:hypothetical protein
MLIVISANIVSETVDNGGLVIIIRRFPFIENIDVVNIYSICQTVMPSEEQCLNFSME